MYRQELHPVGRSMKLCVGDRVREPSGRHVGRVEAIHHARAFVKVAASGAGTGRP
jgi:hypothetical protein